MNIIVRPTDFSELANGALPWARKMADAFDAKIHCLHVVRDTPYAGGLEIVLPETLPTTEELIQQFDDHMRSYIDTEFADWGERVIGKVRRGVPFVEIIRYAREVQAMMIVMSTHGYSGLTHMLVGSTTEAVVRKADCPVFSIRSPEMRFEMP
jgi:nucleotide-binding universal stress UspA family protein